jgi:hypothetical protein
MDLCETLLDYIPSYRINDVIYLDPSDLAHTFFLNPLEVTDTYQMELVVSGIIAIFHKLYGNSWGPRLEYILRNTLFTAVQLPEATLLMVPELLTNENFRRKALQKITDPILKNFWEQEFAHMQPRLRNEAISPILNKAAVILAGSFVILSKIRDQQSIYEKLWMRKKFFCLISHREELEKIIRHFLARYLSLKFNSRQ